MTGTMSALQPPDATSTATPRSHRVAVTTTGLSGYPTAAPFHPAARYPEQRPGPLDPTNEVYGAVRETLRELGLDADHYDTPAWNPLGTLIRPGMTVLVKPNSVSHEHWAGASIFSVVTHAAVIRPLLDYIQLALEGRGRIIVGDSPFLFGDFHEAMSRSGLTSLLDWFREQTEIPVECFDLRAERAIDTWAGKPWGRERVEQDPRGYVWVDLRDESYFRSIDPGSLRIGVASPRDMFRRHSDGRHEYRFPRSVLASDVVVHVPKLKTHRRGGVSLGIKSFIGLPADKRSLPHYRVGAPENGGDQYPHRGLRRRICSWLHDQVQSQPWIVAKVAATALKKGVWASRWLVPLRDEVDEAMWPGNDTLWRTLLDLVRVAYYAAPDGRLRPDRQRTHFFLIDGIIGGERNGPIAPDPVPAGVLVAGSDPAFVDAVAATLMGFEAAKIPMIARALDDRDRPRAISEGHPSQLRIRHRGVETDLSTFAEAFNLGFAPHPNWTGSLERRATDRR